MPPTGYLSWGGATLGPYNSVPIQFVINIIYIKLDINDLKIHFLNTIFIDIVP